MLNCIFCKIVKGEMSTKFVYEDDKVVVFHDIRPKARVHLLIVPREHIENLKAAEEKHQSLLAHMLFILPKLADSAGLDSGFRTIINTGKGGGQEVDHLHFHLLGGGLPAF